MSNDLGSNFIIAHQNGHQLPKGGGLWFTNTKMRTNRFGNKLGFSMIELLITLAILAIIFLIFLAMMVGQTERAHDAERKSDLERIKTAFEEYYNDHQCYPDPAILNECGSDALQPYLNSVPCDPVTNEPYYYEPLADICSGYRLFAELRSVGSPANFVGDECLHTNYNYVVAVGTTSTPDQCILPSPVPAVSPSASPVASPEASVEPSVEPSPIPSPSSPASSPSPSGPPKLVYGCDILGVCNDYEPSEALKCGKTYDEPTCNYECPSLPAALRCN